MKPILIFIACFTICLNYTFTQIPIPFPSEKPQNYEDSTYYEHWEESNTKFIEAIKNDTFNRHLHYYNRFNSNLKALTDDPSDILYLFFEGVEHDKDQFCWFYSKRNKTDFQQEYYKREFIIMDQVCNCVFSSYNREVIQTMKTIQKRDQKFRKPKNLDAIKQRVLDSINLSEIMPIYEKYGYPNRKIVGVEFETTMFYVILHSNLEVMEKFLPVIFKETKNNRLRMQYPLLHDRINVLKGLPQEFGTQSYYTENGELRLYKLKGDLTTVNQRRKMYQLNEIQL